LTSLNARSYAFLILERQRMEANKETKKLLEEAKYALEVAQRDGQFDRASQLRYSTIPDLERKLPHHDSDGSSPFGAEESAPGLTIHDRVTSGDIARVVAKSTGTWQVNLLTGLFK
jgi:ATP-dependent Clp protease ATP-binding subunit ClpB